MEALEKNPFHPLDLHCLQSIYDANKYPSFFFFIYIHIFEKKTIDL